MFVNAIIDSKLFANIPIIPVHLTAMMTYSLDITNTMISSSGYHIFTLIIGFLFLTKVSSDRALRLFMLASGACVLGTIQLMIPSPAGWEAISLTMANVLIIVFFAATLLATQLFNNTKPSWLFSVSCVLAYIVVYRYPTIFPYVHKRIIVSTLFPAIILIRLLWHWLSAVNTKAPTGRWLAMLITVIDIIICCVRAYLAWKSPDTPNTGLTKVDQRQILLIMMMYWCSFGYSVCFFYLIYERTMGELLRQARTDGLTGLLNHITFKKEVALEFASAQKKNKNLSLILLDLDHFKNINDKHGHIIGDKVLACFADCLRQYLDTKWLAGRYGGEEFCILLPGVSLDDATHLAERLRTGIAAMKVTDMGGELSVTTSIGVSCLSDECSTMHDLFSVADSMLYKAKQTGRNRVEAMLLIQ